MWIRDTDVVGAGKPKWKRYGEAFTNSFVNWFFSWISLVFTEFLTRSVWCRLICSKPFESKVKRCRNWSFLSTCVSCLFLSAHTLSGKYVEKPNQLAWIQLTRGMHIVPPKSLVFGHKTCQLWKLDFIELKYVKLQNCETCETFSQQFQLFAIKWKH